MRVLASNDPDSARAAAREILNSRRYRDVKVSRPFEHQLRWVGHQIDRFFSRLGRLFNFAVPGSGAVSWVVFGVIGTIALAWLAQFVGKRRRGRSTPPVDREFLGDPNTFDREADEAERFGDHRRAVELRFRAGILRLEIEAALVATKRTNLSIGASVPGPFEGLGEAFDAIHYGDAAAGPTEVEQAKRVWPQVHDAARLLGKSPRARRFGRSTS